MIVLLVSPDSAGYRQELEAPFHREHIVRVHAQCRFFTEDCFAEFCVFLRSFNRVSPKPTFIVPLPFVLKEALSASSILNPFLTPSNDRIVSLRFLQFALTGLIICGAEGSLRPDDILICFSEL